MAPQIFDGVANPDVIIDRFPQVVPEPSSCVREGGEGITFLGGRLCTPEYAPRHPALNLDL